MFFYTRKILTVLAALTVAGLLLFVVHAMAAFAVLGTLSCVLQLFGVLEAVPGASTGGLLFGAALLFVASVGAIEFVIVSWYELPDLADFIREEATAKRKMRYVR